VTAAQTWVAVTRRTAVGRLVAASILGTAMGACSAVEPVDLVVLDGKVVTMDAEATVAEAVAIRDGRIVFVGPTSDARAMVGRDTTVVEAAGRTVIPGIIDSHVHGLMAATAEVVNPFRNLGSVAEIQTWVRDQAATTNEGTLLWTPRVFPTRVVERRFPTRAELDQAAPHHPVVVDGAYAVMLNTAALEAAHITRDTSDPPGGAIVRNADGQPTGLLRNVGALLAQFRPSMDVPVELDHLERVHHQYVRAGITSIVERAATVDGYDAYAALFAQDRLHVRSTVTLQVPRFEDRASVVRFMDSLPLTPGTGDEWLKVGALKILVDGGILAGTSFMRDPYGLSAKGLYGVDDPSYRGMMTVPRDQIIATFAAGQSRGWQMAAHVTGDAGVDAVLDAFEATRTYGDRDSRHTLIHAYFPTPRTARRAARLGVLVDTQPAWYYRDADGLAEGLGEQRLRRFIGLRTWLDAGVRTAINTDHMFGLDGNTAMNPFNPFLTMYVAVSRKTESGQVIGDDQHVTREEALRMMTLDAAYLTFDETSRGSLEVGKLGDLVVLSDDLLTCPEDDIKDIVAETTVIAGRVAYQR
jgi:predicted amidohydrolase YtcJ